MLIEGPLNPNLIEQTQPQEVAMQGFQQIYHEALTMADQMRQSNAEVGAAMEKVFTLNRDFAVRNDSEFVNSNTDVSCMETNLNSQGDRNRRDGYWYEVKAIGPRQLKVTCRRDR